MVKKYIVNKFYNCSISDDGVCQDGESRDYSTANPCDCKICEVYINWKNNKLVK